MENQIRTGRPFLSPRSASFYWLFQSDQKLLEPQKRFVKKPFSANVFGQNKTLKPCQNNVVINTGAGDIKLVMPPDSVKGLAEIVAKSPFNV